MRFLIGVITVLGCVLGIYASMGGKLSVLVQPGEFGIIIGTAIGSFIISNPRHVIIEVLKALKNLFKGMPYNKESYLQLLNFIFEIFKVVKAKGMLAIESDLEKPNESEIFKKYPKFSNDHHAVTYFCDYMRVINMGVDNHYQIEDIMLQEQDTHHNYNETIVGAVTAIADSLPAIGIVAAVLGIIKTMGHVSEPPEILGKLIAGALVGTFLGVLCAYGFIAPIAAYLNKYFKAKSEFLECIKVAIISQMQANAPTVTVEFARKVIPDNVRPTFQEVEEKLNAPTST